jgi:hypothetical protein
METVDVTELTEILELHPREKVWTCRSRVISLEAV